MEDDEEEEEVEEIEIVEQVDDGGEGEVVGVSGAVSAMPKKDLQDELRFFDLPTSGNIATLAQRLQRRIDSGLGYWIEGGAVEWTNSSLHSSSGP